MKGWKSKIRIGLAVLCILPLVSLSILIAKPVGAA
jgi:hypothetical protein